MAEPLRAIGYHGTAQAVAQTILRDGFTFSRNVYDGLGDGIYFFQDTPNRAREWAQQRHGLDAVVTRFIVRLAERAVS